MTEAGAQGIGGFYRGCLVLVDDHLSPFNGLQAHVKNVRAIGLSDAKLSLRLWSDGPNFQELYVSVWTRRGLRLGYLSLCRIVIRLDRSQCTRVLLTADTPVRIVAHSYANGPGRIVYVEKPGYRYPPSPPLYRVSRPGLAPSESFPCSTAVHTARRSAGGPASRSVAVHRLLTCAVSRYSVGTTMWCDERVIPLGEEHLLLDRAQTEPSHSVRHSLCRLSTYMYLCSIWILSISIGPARGLWTNLGRLPLRVFSIGKYAFQKKLVCRSVYIKRPGGP
jgi:hypothetical protein